MTTPTTPHPLATEAAHKAIKNAMDRKGFDDVWNDIRESDRHEIIEGASVTIHTTALEPVIQAANELARFVRHNPLCAFSISGGKKPCNCGLDPAADKWLTLTSPEKANPSPLAGSRRGFDTETGKPLPETP